MLQDLPYTTLPHLLRASVAPSYGIATGSGIYFVILSSHLLAVYAAGERKFFCDLHNLAYHISSKKWEADFSHQDTRASIKQYSLLASV